MKAVHFDQCRTGLETTKPTKVLLYKARMDQLDGLRCNHPAQSFERADGSTISSCSSIHGPEMGNGTGRKKRKGISLTGRVHR